MKDLLELLRKKAQYDKNLDTSFTFVTKVELAEELGVTERTIYNRLKGLEEDKLISFKTKHGKGGGVIVTINKEHPDVIADKDSPLEGKTVKAERVFEEYFKPKKPYVGKVKYRTKEEIERDRILLGEQKLREEMLNDEIENMVYLDKDFFTEHFEQPERAYKAYIFTRQYNALLLSYITDWQETAEKYENEYELKLANKAYNRYKNYDVLPNRFIGTRGWTDALRVVDFLENEIEGHIELSDYLAPAFKKTIYLLKKNKGSAPWLSTFYNAKYVEKVADDIKFKNSTMENKDLAGSSIDNSLLFRGVKPKSIVALLEKAYKEGFNFNVKDPVNYLEIYENEFSTGGQGDMDMTLESYVIYRRYKELEPLMIDKLTDYEFENMRKFFSKNIHMQSNSVITYEDKLINYANYGNWVTSMGVKQLIEDRLGDDWENSYYYNVGCYGKSRLTDGINPEVEIREGKDIDFSLNCGIDFKNILLTLMNFKETWLDYTTLRKSINKLGKAIPTNGGGIIDIDQLIKYYGLSEIREKEHRKLLNLTNEIQNYGGKSRITEEMTVEEQNRYYDNSLREKAIKSKLETQNITEDYYKQFD